MGYLELIGIGIGLAVDAAVVSFSQAVSVSSMRSHIKSAHLNWEVLGVASIFGLFQMLMPCIGWCFGLQISGFIEGYSHIIAAIIFIALGVKTLKDVIKTYRTGAGDTYGSENKRGALLSLSIQNVLILALATSIDALAIGVSFSCMGVAILEASLLIGVVTLAVCALAGSVGLYLAHIGKRLAQRRLNSSSISLAFTLAAGLLGSVLLIAIGAKEICFHLMQ